VGKGGYLIFLMWIVVTLKQLVI